MFSYGRRRVIIRKGHVAQRFYFIYSGSVCVTDDVDEESAFVKSDTEQTSLKRGDFFGVSIIISKTFSMFCWIRLFPLFFKSKTHRELNIEKILL